MVRAAGLRGEKPGARDRVGSARWGDAPSKGGQRRGPSEAAHLSQIWGAARQGPLLCLVSACLAQGPVPGSSALSLFPSSAPAALSLLRLTVPLIMNALIVRGLCNRIRKAYDHGAIWKMKTAIVGEMSCVFLTYYMLGPLMCSSCLLPPCESYFLSRIVNPLQVKLFSGVSCFVF